MCVTRSNSKNIETLCNDELGYIFEFVGDSQSIEALNKTCHTFHNIISKVHKVRRRCFYLLHIIRKSDSDVRLFYEQLKQNGFLLGQLSDTESINSQDSSNNDLQFQFDPSGDLNHSAFNFNRFESSDDHSDDEDLSSSCEDTTFFTVSPNLQSLIKSKTDQLTSRIPDMRIRPEFLRKYMHSVSITPQSLLGYLFTHLKEDFIDAISQQPEQVIDAFSPLEYPEFLRITEEENDREVFRLDTIFQQAKKREAGVISLWPSRAEVATCPNQGLLQYLDVQRHEQVVALVIIDGTNINNWSEKEIPSSLSSELSSLDECLPVTLFMNKRHNDTLLIKMKEYTCRFRIVFSKILKDKYVNFETFLLKIINPNNQDIHESEVFESNSLLTEEMQKQMKQEAFEKLRLDIARKKEMSELIVGRSFIENIDILDEQYSDRELENCELDNHSINDDDDESPYGRDVLNHYFIEGCIIS